MIRKIVITLLLGACVWPALAQRPRTRVEWGVIGGINVPDYTTNMSKTDVKNKLGWQAGIVTAVNLGAFAIEPQILYVRQGLRIKPEGAKEINLKSNSIDVPVLVSLRLLRPFRFYAGPVFTVMNDCKQKSGGDLLDFGRVRPTMSYTEIGRHGGCGRQIAGAHAHRPPLQRPVQRQGGRGAARRQPPRQAPFV